MTFAIPTYFFLGIMFLTVVIGLFRYVTGTLGPVADPPTITAGTAAVTGVSLFLILHAFSSGTAALTGVEAISNGITAFKHPQPQRWHHPDVDGRYLGHPVPGDHLPGRPDPCRALGGERRSFRNWRGPSITGAACFTWAQLAPPR